MICPGTRIHASLGPHELGTKQEDCTVCNTIRKPTDYQSIREAVGLLCETYHLNMIRASNAQSHYYMKEAEDKALVARETLILWSLPGVADGQT